MTQNTNKICWAVSTGEAGMVSQVMGLAEATGFSVEQKCIQLRAPWTWMPGHFTQFALKGLSPNADVLNPPWPDLMITCGRRSVAPSIAVRKLSGGKTFTAHVQNPLVPNRYFDLILPPQHDALMGDNVFSTRASIHRVTPSKLVQEAERLASLFIGLPRPLVCVIIGGNSGAHRFTSVAARNLADQLLSLSNETHVGLAVTTSRRTGVENTAILKNKLSGPNCMFWDGLGENPYFAMLGSADYFLVTSDSASMVSEACSTGKPVHIIELEGGNDRFTRFHTSLQNDEITRPFKGKLEDWSYSSLTCTEDAARLIIEKMNERNLD
jgi:mitochondrial fission protein ELM1